MSHPTFKILFYYNFHGLIYKNYWKVNGQPWKITFSPHYEQKQHLALDKVFQMGIPSITGHLGVSTHIFRGISPFEDEKSQYYVMYSFIKNVTKGKYSLHASFLLLQICSFRRLYYNIACGIDAKENTPCNRKMYWHNLLCSPFILSTG